MSSIANGRVCRDCGKHKGPDHFYRVRRGLWPRCKPCARLRQNNYNNENIEARRAYDRSRYADRYARGHFRPKDMDKERARIALRNAVVRGKKKRPDHCERCDTPCHPHGHHEDYTKPLDVQWLCRRCHGIVHRIDEERRQEAA